MQSNATGLLPLSTNLSECAQIAHVLDDLQAPLLSMGQLCDDKCQVVLTEKEEMHVFKNNAIILKGKRNFCDGLWDVPLPLQSKVNYTSQHGTLFKHLVQQQLFQHEANIIIRKDKAKLQLAQYLHAAANCPVISTFL